MIRVPQHGRILCRWCGFVACFHSVRLSHLFKRNRASAIASLGQLQNTTHIIYPSLIRFFGSPLRWPFRIGLDARDSVDRQHLREDSLWSALLPTAIEDEANLEATKP